MPITLDQWLWGTAQRESGHRYDLLGPPTRSGDRAFGKYQVMGSNIPEWTQKAGLGRMTPTEFLANPQAQEAVARTVGGGYFEKYGPEGASSMWHSGRPNIPNVSDGYTRTPDYVRQVVALAERAPADGRPLPPVPSGPKAYGEDSPALGTPQAPQAPGPSPASQNAPAGASGGLLGMLTQALGITPQVTPGAAAGIPAQAPQGMPQRPLTPYQPEQAPPLEMPPFEQLQFAGQQPVRLASPPRIRFGKGFY